MYTHTHIYVCGLEFLYEVWVEDVSFRVSMLYSTSLSPMFMLEDNLQNEQGVQERISNTQRSAEAGGDCVGAARRLGKVTTVCEMRGWQEVTQLCITFWGSSSVNRIM